MRHRSFFSPYRSDAASDHASGVKGGTLVVSVYRICGVPSLRGLDSGKLRAADHSSDHRRAAGVSAHASGCVAF